MAVGNREKQISSAEAGTYLRLCRAEATRRARSIHHAVSRVLRNHAGSHPQCLIPPPRDRTPGRKSDRSDITFPNPRIVDIGTGSGAIPIALAHELPQTATISAIDLSRSALRIARFNAAGTGFADRIRFLQGDLLTPVASEKFEIVVSNPPYIPTTDCDSLSVEVRDHEPALALFAGPDGLDIYRRLIPQAFNHLVTGGYLALEIGYGQSPAIADLLATGGFQQIEFVPDLHSIPRVAVAQRP